MSRALEGLTSLPWGVHAVVALAMATGIVLWLAGQRVLKPLLVTSIVLLGGVIGGLVVPSTSWGASLSVAHGIGIGLVGGLLVGLLLYRSAMAVGFGVVMGAALPLIAATALQFYPIAGSANEKSGAWRGAEHAWERVSDAGARAPEGVRMLAASWMDGDSSGVDGIDAGRLLGEVEGAAPGAGGGEKFAPPLPENLRPAAERIGEVWTDASTRAKDEWASLPAAHQAIIGLAAVIGLAGGVVAGLVLPMWAGGAVTSLFGAAVWLPSFVWLSNAMSAPWRSWLDRSPAVWLAIWGVVALIGMIFQWRSMRSRKPKVAVATPAAA